MSNFISFILILPILIWSIFQPALYTNAMLIEQALSNVVYETQKEASLQGRYDEAIYQEIKDKLVEVHNFDPTAIQIVGTETLTMRGERMFIDITIPKPSLTVIEAFTSGTSEPYHYRKYIMSEYID